MLVGLQEVLVKARAEKQAIAAFNVPNLEMIRAAIQAAEEVNTPVILQHAEGHGSLISLEEIGPIMLQYAKRSKVPVVVHLDHGKSFEMIMQAMKLGFTSVMIDASDLPFEENIARTKEIVKIAHSLGVSVEAELGHVFTSSLGGGEGRAPDDDQIGETDIYTDPKQAKDFVDATAVDCLAVAFGTVHGVYLKEPKLDLDRVKKIYDEVKIPLVMHGGSGVEASDYRTAIENGIAKINYYTYANQAAPRIEGLPEGG
ncbi:class II fructose-bisphosphate aldolase [Enterococcus avium]